MHPLHACAAAPFVALQAKFADEHQAARRKAQAIIDAIVADFGESFDGHDVRHYLPSADQIPHDVGANEADPDDSIPDLKERTR